MKDYVFEEIDDNLYRELYDGILDTRYENNNNNNNNNNNS